MIVHVFDFVFENSPQNMKSIKVILSTKIRRGKHEI